MRDEICKLADELANAYLDWRNAEEARRMAAHRTYSTPIAQEAHEQVIEVLAVAEKESRHQLDGCANRYAQATEVDRSEEEAQ